MQLEGLRETRVRRVSFWHNICYQTQHQKIFVYCVAKIKDSYDKEQYDVTFLVVSPTVLVTNLYFT